MPRRNAATRRAAAPAFGGKTDRVSCDRARIAGRDRRGDARRVDLRARADCEHSGRVGGCEVRSLRRLHVGMSVRLEIDGKPLEAADGATILEACRDANIDTPTLCYLENLTPVNVC